MGPWATVELMPVSKATGEFFNSRPEMLSKAIQQAFEAMTAGLEPAEVLGLGLYSDMEASSITAAVYTRAGHEASLAKYAAPEYADAVDPLFSWEIYLRWSPHEWDRSTAVDPIPEAHALEAMWAEMRGLREQVGPRDQRYWPSLPFEALTIAMGYLQDDGWYARFPGSLRNFEVMGVEVGLEVHDDMYRWARLMNDETPEVLDGLSSHLYQERCRGSEMLPPVVPALPRPSPETGEFLDSRVEPLSQALRQVFEALTADLDPADVLGLGLFSDAHGTSIVAAVSTRAGHEANLAQHGSPKPKKGASFDWDLHLRWSPEEWDRSTATTPTPAAEPLERIWTEMRAHRDQGGPDDQLHWPSLQLETAREAMGVLRDEEWFDTRFPGSIRNVAVMGAKISDFDMQMWGACLNEPDSYEGLFRYVAQRTGGD